MNENRPELLKGVLAFAEKAMENTGVVPSGVVCSDGNELFIADVCSPDHVVNIVKSAIADKNAIELVYIAEAWMADCDITDYRHWDRYNALMAGATKVSDLPDKIEVVMVTYSAPHKDIIMLSRISRDPDRLSEWEMVNKQCEGRFATFSKLFE